MMSIAGAALYREVHGIITLSAEGFVVVFSVTIATRYLPCLKIAP
jgi:hypothetical protein